jgi:hypothetical protein
MHAMQAMGKGSTAVHAEPSAATHINQVHLKSQRHPIMWVVRNDKAIVHQQEVIAEGAVAQQQRLSSSNLDATKTTVAQM